MLDEDNQIKSQENSKLNSHNLTESIDKKLVDKLIQNKFGGSTPGDGCIFISTNGKFINIYPELEVHEELCHWLEDQGIDQDEIVEDAEWITDTFNYIRCRSSLHMCFAALPTTRLTPEQYKSLELWMYEKVSTQTIQIYIGSESHTYDTDDYFPEDIIELIKRFYSSGILYETVAEDNSEKRINSEIYNICKQVRKEVVDKYGDDFLQGKCIEASERLVELLKQHGISAKTVEGWVNYDYCDGCSDRPYDEHTWVETSDGLILDVTATQFNSFMKEDYPEIIMQTELPYGYSYNINESVSSNFYDADTIKKVLEEHNHNYYSSSSMCCELICESLYYDYNIDARYKGRTIYINNNKIATIKVVKDGPNQIGMIGYTLFI